MEGIAMKKFFLFVLAAAAVFASCKKDAVLPAESQSSKHQIIAYLDNESKTILDGLNVNWKEADQIKLSNGAVYTAEVPSATEPGRAVFTKTSGNDPTAAYRAFYPTTSYSATSGYFVLPSTQTYAGEDISLVSPMYAVAASATDNTLQFYNVCGLLALDLKGSYKVGSIAVTAPSGKYISGTLSDIAINDGALTYSSFRSSGRSNKVTLNCPTPVQLNNETATRFYVALPEGTYNTLTITVTTSDGRTATIASTSACSVVKNQIFRAQLTPALNPVTFSITHSNITYNSADFTIRATPSTVHYYADLVQSSVIASYGASFVASTLLNNYAKQYGVEAVYEQICEPGTYNSTWEDLDPETEYTAFAVAVDEELNLVSDVATGSFTTLEEPNRQFYGNAVWHDVFVSTIFNMEGKVIDMPCDVYTDPDTPGVFYFDSPYNYANIASWFGLTPEEMKQYTNWKRVTIAIDCSDPDAVKMPVQELGVSMSSTYGYVSGGMYYGNATYDNFGTYADNTITFVGDGATKYVYWSMANYSSGQLRVSKLAEDFTVEITEGGSPVYPDAVVATSKAKSAKDIRSHRNFNQKRTLDNKQFSMVRNYVEL